MLYDSSLEPVFGYRGPYFFLSNFYTQMDPVCETFKGVFIEYPTVEHAYQAAKSLNARVRQAIANQPTAGRAKRHGRRIDLRSDWEQVKDEVMLHWIREKFQQSHLQRWLLNTGRRRLVEANSHGDTYWGTDLFGDGLSRLGDIQMLIRKEIALDLGVW